jgi:membrane-associated phospholipid phosphatase
MSYKVLQLLFIVCINPGAAAQDTAVCIPGKPFEMQVITPKKWQFITNVPADLLQIARSPFNRSNLTGTALVVASTALLLPFDQKILDGVKQVSDQIHLQPQTDYKVLVKSGETKIIKLPRNINTALYQLGEGGTSMLIGGGLFIYGKLRKDKRALQTASDIAETFITMGITTQVLKRISGRQSPFMRTQPGGAWHPFPSFKEYQQNTSNYDAFPSGHLATMMATVTVLTNNYPEKKWIGILGYSLIGLSGWAMINTEVHWIADYPLALALGYISGKITCLRHKKTNHALVIL